MKYFKDFAWIRWLEYFDSVTQKPVKIYTSAIFSLRTRIFTLRRVLTYKLLVTKLVKNFPIFNRTTTFITLFTSARPCTLSWTIWIQSTSLEPVLRQLNPISNPKPYLFNIVLNLLPLMPISSKLSLLRRVHDQNFLCIFHIPLFLVYWTAEKWSASYKNNLLSRFSSTYTHEY